MRTPVLIHNRVLFALIVGILVALVTTGFMSTAPNRLADGTALPIWHAPALLATAVVGPSAALVLLSLAPPGRKVDAGHLLLAILLAGGLLVAAGLFARALTQPGHLAQRQALGPAFWISFALAFLAILDAMRRLSLKLTARVALLLFGLAAIASLAALDVFGSLSLAREFESHRSLFGAALLRHLGLVGAALVLSVAFCAPLVVFVRRHPGRSRPVYAALSLVQTVPSIALFGMLIAPLTALAARVPLLKTLGVSGLGATPALIALVLYAAFPLVRMSDAAFAAIEPAVTDAARGLGFGRGRRFFAVDLPLAFPVLVSGLRVVTLQAIGLATVAALIGGGGLGTFIFEGIGEYALDLVLIGAIPVILLALAADFGFRIILEVWTQTPWRDQTGEA